MRKLLPRLERASRYLGCEWGAVRAPGPEVQVRVALAFPDLYDVGMSYLGQKILYRQINADPRFHAERAFAPAEDAAALMRESGAPLSSLETDAPLAGFDLIAFSLTHELAFTNVPYMLELAGIPLTAAERKNSDRKWPIILAGGGAAFNLEPVADFFDAAGLGDGEALLPGVLETLALANRENWDRERILTALDGQQGVYVPEFWSPGPGGRMVHRSGDPERSVVKAIVADLEAEPFPAEQVAALGQTAHDRLVLEIARGCTRGCRFCQAGILYRPVRERTPETARRLLEQGLDGAGFEEVSFLALSAGDYSALQGLFDECHGACVSRQAGVCLPSLRVGSLSPSVVRALRKLRRTGATIAPEAGSQRLRDVINKGVTAEGPGGLIDHVRLLAAEGWRSVKLYFMIGLPTETDEDVAAIFDLCDRVANAPRRDGRGKMTVSASISPYVPKPHTPFQWEPAISIGETRRKVGLLLDLFKTRKYLTLKWHNPAMSRVEAVLARGGRELNATVMEAWRQGALFDGWKDRFDPEAWERAFAATGIDVDAALAGRDVDTPLPWDHLSTGVSREFLLRERAAALEEWITEDCRFGACANCGVCFKNSPLGPDIRPRLVNAVRDQEAEAAEIPHESTLPKSQSGKPERPEIPEELTRKAEAWLLSLRKLGPAAFLSQLELARALERAARRAGLPVAFSQGYHPMPLISYGPALPVGFRSLDERVVIVLREPMAETDVLERLDGALPKGLSLVWARRYETQKAAKADLSGEVERYGLLLAETVSDLVDVGGRIDAFLARTEFQATRKTKSGERVIDVRAPVLTLRRASPRRIELALAAAKPGEAGRAGPLDVFRAVFPECAETLPEVVKLTSGDATRIGDPEKSE